MKNKKVYKRKGKGEKKEGKVTYDLNDLLLDDTFNQMSCRYGRFSRLAGYVKHLRG
jgi:hypothetical protein